MKPPIEKLIKALQSSWSAETCFDASEWSSTNPARGQCVVSSLVIQNYLGGELLRYRVSGGNINETHYCNILSGGTVLDTTASQYREPVILKVAPVNLKGFTSIREKRLAENETRKKYELLLGRVEAKLERAEL
jgi:hypothetical protein